MRKTIYLPDDLAGRFQRAIGNTFYVSLFGGAAGKGPEVVTMSKKGQPFPFLTGFAAPTIALGVNKGSVYVAPKLSPTETSMHTEGAVVGVERKDGSGLYGGMDTSSARPSYSVGGSTGGPVSLTGGVESDGKEKHGVKAGVKIRY